MRHPGLSVRACAALVALEAVGLAVVAFFYLVELVVATAGNAVRALVTVGLCLAAAAAIGLVARGLLLGRRWARSPALVTNLIVLPVAVGLFQGGRWYVGLPLLAMGLAVVVLLFLPGTAARLED